MPTDLHAAAPVEHIPTDPADEKPQPGVALCLSGGGYRTSNLVVERLIV